MIAPWGIRMLSYAGVHTSFVALYIRIQSSWHVASDPTLATPIDLLVLSAAPSSLRTAGVFAVPRTRHMLGTRSSAIFMPSRTLSWLLFFFLYLLSIYLYCDPVALLVCMPGVDTFLLSEYCVAPQFTLNRG
ncbi:hypothetical protein A0H81_13923 [Grifola frondosa]|uniref:Uncharacterized protein n=1 Tax=Grifola frondosa TaxID=5627 RepID=A0A1C7LPW0_GRIFR|nr:hypothetical protein A0H81_13923 [Grifola frondosa]